MPSRDKSILVGDNKESKAKTLRAGGRIRSSSAPWWSGTTVSNEDEKGKAKQTLSPRTLKPRRNFNSQTVRSLRRAAMSESMSRKPPRLSTRVHLGCTTRSNEKKLSDRNESSSNCSEDTVPSKEIIFDNLNISKRHLEKIIDLEQYSLQGSESTNRRLSKISQKNVKRRKSSPAMSFRAEGVLSRLKVSGVRQSSWRLDTPSSSNSTATINTTGSSKDDEQLQSAFGRGDMTVETECHYEKCKMENDVDKEGTTATFPKGKLPSILKKTKCDNEPPMSPSVALNDCLETRLQHLKELTARLPQVKESDVMLKEQIQSQLVAIQEEINKKKLGAYSPVGTGPSHTEASQASKQRGKWNFPGGKQTTTQPTQKTIKKSKSDDSFPNSKGPKHLRREKTNEKQKSKEKLNKSDEPSTKEELSNVTDVETLNETSHNKRVICDNTQNIHTMKTNRDEANVNIAVNGGISVDHFHERKSMNLSNCKVQNVQVVEENQNLIGEVVQDHSNIEANVQGEEVMLINNSIEKEHNVISNEKELEDNVAMNEDPTLLLNSSETEHEVVEVDGAVSESGVPCNQFVLVSQPNIELAESPAVERGESRSSASSDGELTSRSRQTDFLYSHDLGQRPPSRKPFFNSDESNEDTDRPNLEGTPLGRVWTRDTTSGAGSEEGTAAKQPLQPRMYSTLKEKHSKVVDQLKTANHEMKSHPSARTESRRAEVSSKSFVTRDKSKSKELSVTVRSADDRSWQERVKNARSFLPRPDLNRRPRSSEASPRNPDLATKPLSSPGSGGSRQANSLEASSLRQVRPSKQNNSGKWASEALLKKHSSLLRARMKNSKPIWERMDFSPPEEALKVRAKHEQRLIRCQSNSRSSGRGAGPQRSPCREADPALHVSVLSPSVLYYCPVAQSRQPRPNL